MSEAGSRIQLETCMDIQYISSITGKGIDMFKEKQLFQSALDVIIDGVALSTAGENRAQAGVYLMGLVVADNQGRFDAEKAKAIQAIIEMAAEVESLN